MRDELKVTLCRDYLDDDSRLSVIRLHEDFERQLEESITRTADGAYLTVGREKTRNLLDWFEDARLRAKDQGQRAIFLTTPVLRPVLRYFLERRIPNIVVLSETEIPDGIEVVKMAELVGMEPTRSGTRMW